MVSRITADELADRVDGAADDHRPFTPVDPRPLDSFDSWHIHGAENVPFDPDDDALVDGDRGSVDRSRGRVEPSVTATIGDSTGCDGFVPR